MLWKNYKRHTQGSFLHWMECFKNGKCVLESPWNVVEHFVQKRVRTLLLQKGQNEKGPLGKKKQPVSTNCGRVINTVMFWWLQASFRACLHEAGGPQVGEVICDKLSHLTCKRDHIKMRDYMDRWVTPPKRVTSPTWGPHLHVNRPLEGSKVMWWVL